jgi:hypothetical protein
MARHADSEPAAPGPYPGAGTPPVTSPPTQPSRPASHRRTQVFLHIGEPKTGTTFLQQVMWRNRAELAAQGVVLPGHHPQDHYRASQDLRGIAKLASDPAGSWTGEWEILARQAQQAPRVAVISHELFSAADPEQADRAVRSLEPAEVHVVVTVRDMGTLLPAEWQETVKHRNARRWEDWLEDVIDRESYSADRRQFWFWRVHDTAAVLGVWSRHLPADRIHVITVPPRGSDNALLWQRFASLIGVDPASVDTSRARSNTSLGLPEIEFLRRLNEALPEEVPDWFYMWNVKEAIAHQALAARPRTGRLVLPPDREDWAAKQAEILIATLGESSYDVVGSLDDLRPPRATEPAASPAASPADASADPPAEQVLDAAVAAASAMIVRQFHRAHPAAKPQPSHERQRGLVARVESTVASSPRLKRTVRELSSRSPAVRRLRILAWRRMEKRRAGKHV